MIETDSHTEMIDWLKESKLIPNNSFSNNSTQLMAEFLYLSLLKATQEEKIQLLDFEWAMLPREYIKITIVTEKEKREFTYNL
jgi:hypothetical protein